MNHKLTNVVRGWMVCAALLFGSVASVAAAEGDAPEAAGKPASVQVEVRNPLDIERPSETIELGWKELAAALPGVEKDKVRVIDGASGREVVSQPIDSDGDNNLDALLFQGDFKANETRTYTVQAAPSELEVESPVFGRFVPERKDDFAWESDRIGFRVYGPALRVETVSNGIDVWVKRVKYPVVNKFYKMDNYHEDHGEGADMYKVGETLGCGGSGLWLDGKLYRGENFAQSRVLANGPIRTLFLLHYDPLEIAGTKMMDAKRISIDAGHNLNRIESIYFTENEEVKPDLAAGLVQRDGLKTLQKAGEPWAALWGPVDPAGNGELGIGVVMTPDVFKKVVEAEGHVMAIGGMTPNEPVVYWAGAGWTKSGQFANAQDWAAYLSAWSKRVATPMDVELKK